MRGSTHVVAACAVVLACACGTGDTRIDPGDLELRDLLGVSPEAAGRWDDEQRASARRVFEEALDESGEPIEIGLAGGDTADEVVAHSLASLDARRFAEGEHALGFVRVQIDGAQLAGSTRAAPTLRTLGERDAKAMPAVQLELSESWRGLPQLSQQVLTALATDAGAREGDRVIVVPASRLPVIASFVASSEPRLLVNPVLLAAIDPGAVALAPTTNSPRDLQQDHVRKDDPGERPHREPGFLANNGNPYSFYGSINECAYAQRSRCEACLSSGDCVPVTTSSGVDECNALAANDGRGYYLLCINLSLAISSVDACTADVRPSGCPRDPNAASSLSQLEANAVFLDDTQCGNGLDACLAKIYGDSDGNYPGFGIDAGVDPVDPPRDIDVSCGDSCDGDKSANCEFSPNCNCEGPSCGNSFSCDSSCSNSNSQSGCNDNCQSCSSDDGGSSSSGGSCGGDSSSGGSDCGGSCGDSSGCNGCSDSGSSGGGSSGGSCGGSSGGGSSGGDCGGGCSGGDSGGGCGGGGGSCGGGGDSSSSCGGGGGGGGGCQVAKRPPNAIFAMALSMTWALLPLPLAAYLRRRSKKQKKTAANNNATNASADEEVAS